MSRKPIIFGNWKMNKTPSEAKEFFEGIKGYVTGDEAAEYGIGAPYVDLAIAVENAGAIKVAAENCNELDSGAYTGEVSVPMLKEVGITYCIIGHSERREYYAETSAHCAAKAKRLFAADITPILCVGESLAQREEDKTAEVVTGQLRGALKGLEIKDGSQLVIAYEPIWAIGTGKTDTPEGANEIMILLRKTLAEIFGQEIADKVRLLYGGSVKPNNVAGFMACSDIDGALVGGASLKADSFAQIVRY